MMGPPKPAPKSLIRSIRFVLVTPWDRRSEVMLEAWKALSVT